MENEETIIISKKLYNELIAAAEKLSVLEAVGVDNWEGYDIAMEMLQKDE